jgi:hypothetical protein
MFILDSTLKNPKKCVQENQTKGLNPLPLTLNFLL